MRTLILILSALLVLTSCGAKKSSSSVKLKLSKIFGTGTPMNGGIILSGHTLDDSEGFNIGITDPNQEIILNLKKGDWEFLAVGWTGGAGFFSGSNQCAYVGPIKIDGDSMNVVFNLNYITCGDVPNHGAVLAPASFLDSTVNLNQFLSLQIISCNILDFTGKKCVNSSGAGPIAGDGLTRSVQIVMNGQGKGSVTANPLPSIGSVCIQVPNATSSLVDIHIPVGNVNNKIIPINVLAYTTGDCTGLPIDYAFKDKSMVDGINLSTQKAIVKSEAGPKTVLYLEHNPQTVSNNIGVNPFGYGKDGDLSGGYAMTVSEYAHVINMQDYSTPVKTAITFEAGHGSSIQINDEILLYVNNDYDGNGCGGGFVSGMFMSATVVGKTGDTIVVDRDLKQYTLRPPGATATQTALSLPTNTSLAASYGTVGSCSIQVVKVKNFRDVNLSSGSVITGYDFSSANNFGGILPIKISGTLTVNATTASTPAYIKSYYGTGRGFDNTTTQNKTAPCYTEGKACIYFGTSSSSLNYGGGILFAYINKISLTAGTATDPALVFNVSGGSTSTPTTANGGQANIKVGEIAVGAGTTTPGIGSHIKLYSDAAAASGGSANTPGILYFDYCTNSTGVADASLVTFSLSGGVAGFSSLNQKCNF